LPFCSEPKYIGVTFDRSFTYRRHPESLHKRLTSRVVFLKLLAGSGWGAALVLVHSTAEYCAPVQCRSAHTRLIDPANNDALRIVTGCLRPTPVGNLPVLAGIQPAGVRRKGATLSLARRAVEPRQLLHTALTCLPSANARRVNSRHPFVPGVQQLISSFNSMCAAHSGKSCDKLKTTLIMQKCFMIEQTGIRYFLMCEKYQECFFPTAASDQIHCSKFFENVSLSFIFYFNVMIVSDRRNFTGTLATSR